MFSSALVFTAQLLMTSGLSVEEGKQEACRHDVLVTAILEDIESPSHMHLFSEDLMFDAKVSDFEIEGVKNVAEVFPQVEGPIEAAMYSKALQQFLLGKKDVIKAINNTDPLVFDRDYDLPGLKKYMNTETGMANIKDFFSCASLYVEREEVGLYQDVRVDFVDFSGKMMSCLIVVTLNAEERKRGHCRSRDGLPNPSNIPHAQLMHSSCEGMSAVKVPNETYTWRFVLADKTTLRMWHDHDLVKSMELSQVFGCKSMMVILVVVACIVVIIVFAAVGVVVYVVRKKSHGAGGMDESSVTDAKTYVSRKG